MHLTDSQAPFAFTRRDALKASTAAAATLGAFAFGPAQAAPAGAPDERRGATKRYPMLKSINQWAFPYPHHPEALRWQTSDPLDRILGRKV